MKTHVFKSYKEANAFAKNLPKDQRSQVRVISRDDQFVVEKCHQKSPNQEGSPPQKSQASKRKYKFSTPKSWSSNRKSEPYSGGWTSLDQGDRRMDGETHGPSPWRVDEGIAGTREDNKTMRTQLRQDMNKRNRGL